MCTLLLMAKPFPFTGAFAPRIKCCDSRTCTPIGAFGRQFKSFATGFAFLHPFPQGWEQSPTVLAALDLTLKGEVRTWWQRTRFACGRTQAQPLASSNSRSKEIQQQGWKGSWKINHQSELGHTGRDQDGSTVLFCSKQNPTFS